MFPGPLRRYSSENTSCMVQHRLKQTTAFPSTPRPAEHEARVLAEVDAFGRDRKPTAADLDASFPFTQAAIQESLRIYPPAALVIREPPAGGMELGGLWVPADAKLQVGRGRTRGGAGPGSELAAAAGRLLLTRQAGGRMRPAATDLCRSLRVQGMDSLLYALCDPGAYPAAALPSSLGLNHQ